MSFDFDKYEVSETICNLLQHVQEEIIHDSIRGWKFALDKSGLIYIKTSNNQEFYAEIIDKDRYWG